MTRILLPGTSKATATRRLMPKFPGVLRTGIAMRTGRAGVEQAIALARSRQKAFSKMGGSIGSKGKL